MVGVSSAVDRAPHAHDRVLVRVGQDGSGIGILEDAGVEVLRWSRRSGFAAVAVANGQSVDALVDELSAQGLEVAPSGRFYGAGAEPTAMDAQWGLELTGHPVHDGKRVECDGSGVVVAVLDSGVAWRDGDGRALAPSLSRVPFVSPADFVNGDGSPDDEHSHGTHIASIIAGDDPLVGFWGVAPGVDLMPVRVLDAENTGHELDLVDGLHHAIDHGADIINVSLSFPVAYEPSAALREAWVRAHEEGVLVVVAAGNEAAEVAWPAASPVTIAVGSVAPEAKKKSVRMADYGNQGPMIDVVAPGGSPGRDDSEDGFDDGVLGQSFDPGDPLSFQYTFNGGTSQAAAFVSGVAAVLLEAGAAPDEVLPAMQLGSKKVGKRFQDGAGAGLVRLDHALKKLKDGKVAPASPLHAGVMPWLKQDKKGAEPSAWVTVLDYAGLPVEKVDVHGVVDGASRHYWACKTDDLGVCRVRLKSLSSADAAPLHWQVLNIADHHLSQHPGALIVASAELDAVQQAVDLVEDRGTLAVHLPGGAVEGLGEVVDSYVVLQAEPAADTRPRAWLLPAAALPEDAIWAEEAVSLDGSGLATSPIGVVPLRHLSLDGSGLATSPIGLSGPRLLRLTAFDGSGLATSPIGFSALSLVSLNRQLGGSGLATSPIGLSVPVFLTRGMLGSSVDAYPTVQDAALDGAWAL